MALPANNESLLKKERLEFDGKIVEIPLKKVIPYISVKFLLDFLQRYSFVKI